MMTDFTGTITTPQGTKVLIANEDADLLGSRWYQQKRANPYIFRTFQKDGKGRSEFLHRVILSRMLGRPLVKGECVDHINGDTFDNRRANLRLATNSQNMANMAVRPGSASGYRGVVWSKQTRKWQAKIGVRGRIIHLGLFTSREEAFAVYLVALKKHYGEFAATAERAQAANIPEWTEAVNDHVYPLEALARKAGMNQRDFLLAQLNQHLTVAETARVLGFHKQAVWNRMKRLGIRRAAAYSRTAGFVIAASAETMEVDNAAS